jgi:hypothetical protein
MPVHVSSKYYGLKNKAKGIDQTRHQAYIAQQRLKIQPVFLSNATVETFEVKYYFVHFFGLRSFRTHFPGP